MSEIPVASPTDIKFEGGVPVIQEGLAFFAALRDIAADISGIHEPVEGKRTPGVESGRAIISLIDSANKRMRPSIKMFEAFLKRMFRVWAELFLSLAGEGFRVSLGKNFKTTVEVPFRLSDYIERFEVEVVEDSAVPKDAVTRANTMLTLASMVFEDGKPGMDRLSIYEALGIDNGEQIKMRIDDAIAREQQMAQMGEMIQQQQQVIGEAQGIINELAGENENIKQAANETFVKASVDREKMMVQAKTSMARERERQSGKERAILLQGEVNKSLARMQQKRG